MRGGMRLGAGRPGWKCCVGSRLRLDVRALARSKVLERGSRFTWAWRTNGEVTSSMGGRVNDDTELLLDYAVNGVPVAARIQLTKTACNYGGERVWFLCPRCSRRKAVLYMSGGRWTCACCANLAYASQSMDAVGRAWNKQNKIERRLAGGTGEWNGWQKPKGMHQKTFDRLLGSIDDLEDLRDAALMVFAQRYLGPAGRIV